MPCLPRDWMSGFITVTLMAVGGVLLSFPFAARAAAQEPPPPPGQVLPEPMMDENTGFKSIFDGKTLKDWDGDPQVLAGRGRCHRGPDHGQEPAEVQ
jgi:hypothetical protein